MTFGNRASVRSVRVIPTRMADAAPRGLSRSHRPGRQEYWSWHDALVPRRGRPDAGQAARVPLQAAVQQPASSEAQASGLIRHDSATVMDIGAVPRGAALLLFQAVSDPSPPGNAGGLRRSCRRWCRLRARRPKTDRRAPYGAPVWPPQVRGPHAQFLAGEGDSPIPGYGRAGRENIEIVGHGLVPGYQFN
jgi:hypothetical protein